MSMSQVLTQMQQKATQECEGAQREVVACLNGLAGFALLQGKVDEAKARYCQVLNIAKLNGSKGVRVDPLQRLHAITHLSSCLPVEVPGAGKLQS